MGNFAHTSTIKEGTNNIYIKVRRTNVYHLHLPNCNKPRLPLIVLFVCLRVDKRIKTVLLPYIAISSTILAKNVRQNNFVDNMQYRTMKVKALQESYYYCTCLSKFDSRAWKSKCSFTFRTQFETRKRGAFYFQIKCSDMR